MLICNHKECDQCGTCVGVCPHAALLLSDHLEVDKERCTLCSRCIKVCPFGALCDNGPLQKQKT